jgi:hypothetical protein
MVVNLIINIIIGSIIAAPILWISGRMIVGSDNATFTDAFMISALATAANYILGSFLGQEIGGLAQLLIYLYLVTKYYETGWVKAAIVAVVNVLLGVVVAYIMIMLGLAGMFV